MAKDPNADLPSVSPADERALRMAPPVAEGTKPAQPKPARRRASDARATGNALPAIIWSTDTNLRYLSSQGGGLAALALRPDEVKGRTLQDYFGTTDPDFAAIAAHRRALKGESVRYMQEWGGRVYDSSVEPLRDEKGKIIGVSGMALDITDRVEAERSARTSEDRFRSLVQHSSDVITIYNSDGVIRFQSPSVEAVLGYRPDELVGHSSFENVHPDDVERARQAFFYLVNNPGTDKVVEFRCRHKNGSWRVLESTGSNLLHDPSVGGIVSNSRDISERKQTDEALSNSQKRLALHAQQTLLGVIDFDPDFKVVEWNPAAEGIFGYRRDEALGKHADFMFSQKTPDKATACWAQLLEQKTNLKTVVQNCTRSGRSITCEWSLTPLIDSQGNILGITCLVQDVTEQRAGDEALRRSEERYRLLFERNLAGVYWSTAEGELVDCNESFARMFGYKSRTQLMTQRSLDIYQQLGDRDLLLAKLRQNRNLTNVEALCRKADGSPIWVLQNVTLIEDGTAMPMIQGTMVDITERKFAEQSLRQAEGKYRSIFENAAEGIFQTTLDGRWLIVNPKMASILGFTSPAELTASPDPKPKYYVDPARRREFARLIEQQGAVYGFESQMFRKDGQTIWVSESARAVRNEHGHLVGFEGTVQDITERRHAEETLRQNERRLRRQNEMLVELSQHKTIESGNLDAALNEITEAAADTLEVEYASVWLLSEDQSLLRCVNLYSRSSNSHTSGKEYKVSDFPIYFHALETERTIDVDDVASDSRSVEFASTLQEQGISSMMDSSIRVGGRVVGVLCQEQIGPKRSWTLDEKNFTGSMADLLALAIEASDRQRAQEALRESETRFRAVAETAASAIYVHQGERFLFVNRASEAISGYSHEELVEMNPFTLVHPDDRHMVRERYLQRMKGADVPIRYEYRIVTKQGETRWLDFSGSMISFGGQMALLATAFDITERKRAEQLQAALYRIAEKTSSARDLDEFFAAIHSILSELVYARNFYIALYDPRTQLLSFPYFVDEQDAPPGPQRPGKGLTEYVLRSGKPYLSTPEQDHELAEKGEVELVGSPSVDWLGVPLKTGDTTFGVLALQSYTEQERFGEREAEILTFVSQSVATAIQRKRDEDALRQSEARYRSQVQSAVFGIYRSSVEDRFLAVNPAMVTMLGYKSQEEVLALNLAWDVYAEAGERMRLVKEYKDRDRIEGIEVRWKRKDGKIITVRLSGRTLRNEINELEGFEMLAEDITEKRALEEQFRQSQKMEAVGRLAGGVAHDFNNLLTVIKGYSELMLDQVQQGDPLRSGVEEVKKAADRAAALTRQLLAFSRKQVLAPKVLDLNFVVNNMEQLLRRLIGEDVELSITLDSALGRTKADPGQTEQVIMNLAVNARDAMPGGGRLFISTSNAMLESNSLPRQTVHPGAYVRLDVADSGTGMSPETLQRIFEPFFTTKEQGKGTGLGLSTVYGIVNQSNGYIDVESEVGKGTTFHIYLPRVDEVTETAAVPAAPLSERKGTETILLVEDEDGVRALARQLLTKHGYTVLDTRHGGEALLVCERHQGAIHLLLTDVILQQVSGRELADRLLKIRPEMKILYMSGYSGDAIEQYGVVDFEGAFLQKPFNTESLISKVREVLDAPATTQTVQ